MAVVRCPRRRRSGRAFGPVVLALEVVRPLDVVVVEVLVVVVLRLVVDLHVDLHQIGHLVRFERNGIKKVSVRFVHRIIASVNPRGYFSLTASCSSALKL